MPNPKKYRWIKLRVHPDALRSRPKLAEVIGLIAAYWQSVENELSAIFMYLLGGHEVAALEIFNELIDRNLRKQALVALGRERLPRDMLEEAVKLFEKARRIASRRNDVVHGTWTVIDDRPLSLMLIDPAENLKRRHTLYSKLLQTALLRHMSEEFSDASTKDDPLEKDNSEIVLTEYKEQDFNQIIEAISEFRSEIIGFSTKVLSQVVSNAVTERLQSLSPQTQNKLVERWPQNQKATEESHPELPL